MHCMEGARRTATTARQFQEKTTVSEKPKKPGTRREAREAALQFLFSHDLNNETLPDQSADFWELRTARPKVRDFATELLEGIFERRVELDLAIDKACQNYTLARLAAIDRNILRLAVYEILHREDIPIPVTLNEAIEIAKRFGNAQSAAFVNGVLDRIQRDHSRPAGKKEATPTRAGSHAPPQSKKEEG